MSDKQHFWIGLTFWIGIAVWIMIGTRFALKGEWEKAGWHAGITLAIVVTLAALPLAYKYARRKWFWWKVHRLGRELSEAREAVRRSDEEQESDA